MSFSNFGFFCAVLDNLPLPYFLHGEKSGKVSLVCAITEPTLIACSVVRVVTL